MVEFKQIIGRGTRVREDEGKLWFSILDYTGTATQKFADPEFDGQPAFSTQEEISAAGETIRSEVESREDIADATKLSVESKQDYAVDSAERQKFYFDGGHVEIAAHLVYELDADGRQLRVVQLTDYTAEKVRTICSSIGELRNCWSDLEKREELISELSERGIDFPTIAAQMGRLDADPFDLLCYLAFDAPLLTRRQRADRMKKQQVAFFNYYGPEARIILNELMEKYANDGEYQFELPDVLKLPPISKFGNVSEIAEIFGGPERLREAITTLHSHIYATN